MTLWVPSQDERRHPTTAELGLGVTVGIAANTIPYGHIVAVSDQKITYYDEFPALDKGMRKILQIAPNKHWFLAFSADDVTVMQSLLTRIIQDLKRIELRTTDPQSVKEAICAAYSDVRLSQFAMRHLSAIGYSSFVDFKKEGFQELGKDEHQKHMNALYQFDLGVELLVFGFTEKNGRHHIFSVGNPGKCTDWNWQGYSAVGSGSYLALGSLRQRPMSFAIDELIYRLLEAKFVAEANTTVGPTTTLLVLRRDGEAREMKEREIDEIKAAWKQRRSEPPPESAVNVIQKSRVMAGFAED